LHRFGAAADGRLVRVVEHKLRRQFLDFVAHLAAEQEQDRLGSIRTRTPLSSITSSAGLSRAVAIMFSEPVSNRNRLNLPNYFAVNVRASG
jgi:hypothetical protein